MGREGGRGKGLMLMSKNTNTHAPSSSSPFLPPVLLPFLPSLLTLSTRTEAGTFLAVEISRAVCPSSFMRVGLAPSCRRMRAGGREGGREGEWCGDCG